MTVIIPLTKIGFYNPGRLSDEEIEQSFIARVSFFEFLFKKIVAEKPNSIPQQHLVIGQRGMGKSSLLARVAAELRKAAHKDSFIPLSFPEEQYNIDRLSKFWLNCLDSLADALDKEHNTAELAALDAEISILSKEKDVPATTIFNVLKKWGDKIQRRPVLLVDNLSLIFDKINQNEQHQLRAILMEAGAPILIGTSAATIEETVEYKAPFYDAFQISYLRKLTFDESIEVLVNLAKITGREGFEDSIYHEKGRLEALYQLTGGTPRTLAILFPLIQDGFSDNIQTDLDALLDIITPIYKARFEELPPQLQVVLDAVALHWDPINLEQLRAVTMLDNGQLSPQLKRLVEVGWLEKLNAYKAKGNAYEVSERFFNVWYLMRRSSRRQKRELYCLTKFLESFYGHDLHKIARSRLDLTNENANQATLHLALADALKEKRLADRLRNKAYEDLVDMSFTDESIIKSFNIPQNVTQKKVYILRETAFTHYRKKEFVEAESCLINLLKVGKGDQHIWNLLGIVYNSLNKYTDAETAYKKAIELGGTYLSYPWNNIGNLYKDYLRKYPEAEAAYKKSIEIDAQNACPWNGLGALYNDYLRKYPEAEAAYKKAIELDEKFAYPWKGLGDLYKDYLCKYSEAEAAYKKSIELDAENARLWNCLANFYRDLGKYAESEAAYRKAIELDEKYSHPWNGLGNLYADYLHKFEEAELSYNKSLELDSSDELPKYNLLFLWRDKMDKIEEARKVFNALIKTGQIKDTYLLNEALFAFYDKNIGIAEDLIKEALLTIGDALPTITKDDWYRAAAVIVKIGFGNNLLHVLANNGYDVVFKPLYIAVKALTKNEGDLFFNSIAAEVREPALQIVAIMKNYMS
jgi:Flp pilus assembly protein TadD